MRTVLSVVGVIIVVLACILGWNGLATKVEAGREVARQQVAKATPDDVILSEGRIELRRAAEHLAEAEVELDNHEQEYQSVVAKTLALQADLVKHREDLKKERALLSTVQSEYAIDGQRVSRQRLEDDTRKRVDVCRGLEDEIGKRQQEAAAYQQWMKTYREQWSKSQTEYQAKAAELTQLESELRTARVIEGLGAPLQSLSNLQANSDLARLTNELRKRIGRARASAEWLSPADSGLLDLSGDQGSSAEDAADAYLKGLEQPQGGDITPDVLTTPEGFLDTQE